MKRVTFISLFICTNLFFIFFQINKHNTLINLSYKKQKYENEIKELTQKKQELAQNLYNLRKSSTIKKFAKDQLGMNSFSIKQVKKIDLVQASVAQAEKLAPVSTEIRSFDTSVHPELDEGRTNGGEINTKTKNITLINQATTLNSIANKNNQVSHE